MIKYVVVRNSIGEELTITLKEAMPSHGLLIKDIEGLGPPNADIGYSQVINLPGGVYNKTSIEPRNIRFTILFASPKQERDIEDARRKTYKFFSIGTNVTMLFVTDNFNAKISGYVESNEPVIFSEAEETQISIICPDPWFSVVNNIHDLSEIRLDFLTRRDLFEFPFENAIGQKQLIFSETSFTITNGYAENRMQTDTDVPCGIRATFNFNRDDVTNTNAFRQWVNAQDPYLYIETRNQIDINRTGIRLKPLLNKNYQFRSPNMIELSTKKTDIFLDFKTTPSDREHVPFALDYSNGFAQIPPGSFTFRVGINPAISWTVGSGSNAYVEAFSVFDIFDIDIRYTPKLEGI